MFWRPEGWGKRDVYLLSCVPEWERLREAYEAGADAILSKVLKQLAVLIKRAGEDAFEEEIMPNLIDILERGDMPTVEELTKC